MLDFGFSSEIRSSSDTFSVSSVIHKNAIQLELYNPKRDKDVDFATFTALNFTIRIGRRPPN